VGVGRKKTALWADQIPKKKYCGNGKGERNFPQGRRKRKSILNKKGGVLTEEREGRGGGGQPYIKGAVRGKSG